MTKNCKHVIPEEMFGHSNLCPFKNTSGPPCNCERLLDVNIAASMKTFGWTEVQNNSYSRVSGDHIITIARMIDGWQFKWEKGPGMTLIERRGFGTIGHLMTWFWKDSAERLDEILITAWEHSAMRSQLENRNIKPTESKRRQCISL